MTDDEESGPLTVWVAYEGEWDSFHLDAVYESEEAAKAHYPDRAWIRSGGTFISRDVYDTKSYRDPTRLESLQISPEVVQRLGHPGDRPEEWRP